VRFVDRLPRELGLALEKEWADDLKHCPDVVERNDLLCTIATSDHYEVFVRAHDGQRAKISFVGHAAHFDVVGICKDAAQRLRDRLERRTIDRTLCDYFDIDLLEQDGKSYRWVRR
jgi:hypothetical protein